MTAVTTRPRGRRPGRDDTRGTIANSAVELFDRDGYDRTSLRAIARHANVDPALVHHYFDSKAHLLMTVALGTPVDLAEFVSQAIAGDRDSVGARLAKATFQWVDTPDHADHVEAFLSTGAGAGRARVLSEFLAREFFGAVATSFGHRNFVLRGQLASATLFGLLAGRRVLDLGALSVASSRSLTEPFGRALQDYLVEDW